MGVNSQHPFWRRLTGWIAIYALVLHGIFVGLTGPQPTTGATQGYETCLHDADDAAIAPSNLPSKHDGKFHCPLCVAGGHQVVPPTRVSVPSFVISDPGNALWPVSDPPVANSFAYPGKQCRGPPVVA